MERMGEFFDSKNTIKKLNRLITKRKTRSQQNKTMKKGNQMSICIPRVESTITKEYITNIIQKTRLFTIDLINEIPLRNDPTHKRILMKIRWNRRSDDAINAENRLVEEGNIKLVYDMPWYWKICLSH